MTEAAAKFTIFEEKLRETFPDEILQSEEFRGEISVGVKRSRIIEILEFCRSEPGLDLKYLADLTAVDYLFIEKPERYAVVYHIQSLATNNIARLKVYLPETEPSIATASGLWESAIWLEREVFDMYGIRFEGHPDLRRILMPDDYTGHPLRKDYPLKGRGEREAFKVVKRERTMGDG